MALPSQLRGRGLAAGLAAMVIIASLATMYSTDLFASLSLSPGNTVLGDHAVWNVITFTFLEQSPLRLAIVAVLIVVLATAAENGSSPETATTVDAVAIRRTSLASVTAVATAGLVLSFGSTILYMGDGDLTRLYTPFFGAGPLLAALAIAAHQRMGDAAIFPAQAAWLSYSSTPLLVVLLSLLSQLGGASRDTAGTLIAVHAAWAYLRFVSPVAGDESGTLVGDPREEFDYLSLFPAPLRAPLRPLVALLSLAFRALPIPLAGLRGRAGGASAGQKGSAGGYSRIGVDGSGSLPSASASSSAANGYFIPPGAALSTGAQGASGLPPSAVPVVASSALGSRPLAGADPVADRRREKALVSLQNRLAEMRSNMRAGATALPVPPVAAGNAGYLSTPVAARTNSPLVTPSSAAALLPASTAAAFDAAPAASSSRAETPSERSSAGDAAV